MIAKKAAFIYYNHMAASGQIESVPFVFNSIVRLAENVDSVDLFTWAPLKANDLPANVSIKREYTPIDSPLKNLWLRLHRWYPERLYYQFRLKKGYDIVFACGQIGVFIGSALATSCDCKLIYLNDEFPSAWNYPIWAVKERVGARRANVIIVPDKVRKNPLYRELQLADNIPCYALPNTPLLPLKFDNEDWGAKLNIPANSHTFLHAGSIHDWMQLPELLGTVPYWPTNCYLILHSYRPNPDIQRQLAHLDFPQQVRWSSGFLDDSKLNSLHAFCCASFGLYRDVDDNMRYMGMSSGKIMRSLACGTPVIVSNFGSLNFISAHDLGIQVRHPCEIPPAVRVLTGKWEDYKERAKTFTLTTGSFDIAWEEFLLGLRIMK